MGRDRSSPKMQENMCVLVGPNYSNVQYPMAHGGPVNPSQNRCGVVNAAGLHL
jgi:hypothetical protein